MPCIEVTHFLHTSVVVGVRGVAEKKVDDVLSTCPTRFVDFLLPADPSERELLLSHDQRFLQHINRSAVTCYCCCCCCADKKERAYICSGGDGCVAQLLQREVDAHRALEVRRSILSACPDFMLLAAFQFVEDPAIAAVTPFSLAEALAEEGYALTHMDQKLIFRRFDRSFSCFLLTASLLYQTVSVLLGTLCTQPPTFC